MAETRKLAAILAADVVGFSRLTGSDEEGTLARLRTLWSDLIDPTIALHHGRVVKRTGDGVLVEFRSVVDAVRCAIEVQNGMVERNAGLPPERRIEFRVGIHLGDVVEESDGDLMGDGVNIAARLEGIAKPGTICLSEDAYRQVRDRLKEGFIDLGEKELKNIARPVRAYALKTGAEGPASVLHPSVPNKTGPPRLSIVVLPFANIGDDQEQEYFVDGVSESLTTDLSRISGSFVIGRNTAFTYKGRHVDLKQIGSELNVRYVLEGSVQRSGNRLRVNVQLIDAESGAHLWAERFDKPVADFFDVQDEIVARLANQRIFFEGALALDPGNADALARMAFVDFFVATYLFSDDGAARLAAAETALTKALSLAPNHAFAHYCLGVILGVTARAEEGIAECERALALDGNFADAHAVIGARKLYLGRAEETEAHVQEALRLSPRDTRAFLWLMFVGTAKIYLGRYEEAILWLRRSVEANRNNPMSHVFLSAALAILGRPDEARTAARAALALNPQLTVARFRGFFVHFSDNSINFAVRDRIIEGVRKAGVPEG
jgi:TolB-like protein/class 3 adenylate cyclase/Flp pilus assembly protein TadD